MNYYFAPLEGITDLTYRTMHNKYFGGISLYFMPFLSPTQNHCLTKKEQRELPVASTLLCDTIPQILTKSPEDFLWAAKCCADRGYDEVNLNMGCPSGTVVSKGKGSGMLKDIDALHKFLDEIFARCPTKISVKTRIGLQDPTEFAPIAGLLNSYPFSEVIIHPRIREAFYKGPVHMEAFRYATAHCKHSLCYNGDICSPEDIHYISSQFPQVSSVMIGRGLITDPGMLCGGTNRSTIYHFHEELFDEYCRIFANDHNAMCRMKEIWSMMIHLFDESEKHSKKLRKSTDYQAFRTIAREVLTTLPILPPTPRLFHTTPEQTKSHPQD